MIPRIIHQVWEGKTEPVPPFLSKLAATWKRNHPEWQYEFWNEERMNVFVRENFPDLADLYFNYPYSVQRWDAIRYFILYKIGGLYVDLDYECLDPIDNIIAGKECCFSLDPEEHADLFNRKLIITNALMAVSPGHPFFKCIIDNLPKVNSKAEDKINYVLETTGPFFITKLYEQYTTKGDIYLFPTEQTSPLSQKEIVSYMHEDYDDKAMEAKLEKAVAIHYFFGSWYTSQFLRVIHPKTDVLYFSTSNGEGGAANAAYRIHCSLIKAGIESKMMVQKSVKITSNVYVIPGKNTNDNLPLKEYKMKSGSHFSPAVAGKNILKAIRMLKPEFVQFHWINDGFVRIEDMRKIKQKIIWRIPDCWPFTGGCHYFGDCNKYMQACGQCPQLCSLNEDDLSRKVWMRKHESWKELDMTIVVPSQWMKETVEKSSLFGNRKIVVIPNGLDIEMYCPLNKIDARKALNLPLNRKIILFGAYHALTDHRKGFALFRRALALLSEQHKSEYEVVIFGADKTDIHAYLPVRFLGILKDELSLRIAYSAADVMVVPSTEEAFGQTVSEAMACATPVVVFSHTGPASIVDHKINGYIAEKESTESLAEGIEWILAEEIRQKELSEKAREKALATYDLRLIAKQYTRLYERLRQR